MSKSPSSFLVPQSPADLSLTFQLVAGGHNAVQSANKLNLTKTQISKFVAVGKIRCTERQKTARKHTVVDYEGMTKKMLITGRNPSHFGHGSSKRRATKKIKSRSKRGQLDITGQSLNMFSNITGTCSPASSLTHPQQMQQKTAIRTPKDQLNQKPKH